MAQSKITLIGMEKFLNPDHSVFETMQLPEGIDRETLIGTIILRCSEFELLYSDPEFMTDAVNIWSRKHYWTFDRWIKVINKEYEPLYNKDYYEDITDEHEGEYSKEGSGSNSGNNKQTNNLKTENDTTSTHSEKAYNDSSFVATTEDVIDGEIKDTGTIQNQYGNNMSSDESGDDSYTDTHKYHGFGNIGITSAQELLQREIDVARFSVYEHIADLFCTEFCIMVYT